MPKPITLERDARVPLAFTGLPITSVSTERDDSPRWSVLTLYAVTECETEPGDCGWVLESVGHSRVAGEITRRDAEHYATPAELREGLTKTDNRPDSPHRGRRYLPDMALDLLEQAAERDPRLNAALIEVVG